MNKTKNFVLETEKIIDELSSERIEQLQKKLKELVSSSKKM